MATRDMPLIVHAAGSDEDLRLALEDLRMNRWFSARDLLLKTGSDWALRTFRSQVIAAGAADGGAIAAWCLEEPANPDASMMWARVLTRQALRAHRDGVDAERLRLMGGAARDACWKAAGGLPYDPVPWVCLLTLTQLPLDPRSLDPRYTGRHLRWAHPEEQMLPRGPWPLLWEVNRLDPGNREGHHRMREYFSARVGLAAAVDFSRWVASRAPLGSPLLMVPLYALVDDFRAQARGGSVGLIGFWSTDRVRHHARRARDDWFERVRPEACSLLDLNHLAYALTACGEPGAGLVFEAIGPYATNAPWRQVSEALGRDWEIEFRRIRKITFRKEPPGR
ncbi:hypothetical protein ACFTZF_19610 [Streptomyces mirabilis]|uniref:hypothetical protein n=2 Tax=Streptomyces mirabilis TaxID=68239 RepID=UPI003638910E